MEPGMDTTTSASTADDDASYAAMQESLLFTPDEFTALGEPLDLSTMDRRAWTRCTLYFLANRAEDAHDALTAAMATWHDGPNVALSWLESLALTDLALAYDRYNACDDAGAMRSGKYLPAFSDAEMDAGVGRLTAAITALRRACDNAGPIVAAITQRVRQGQQGQP